MQNLTIFKNENFGEVRTILVDNNPYFCLADVCKILDLDQPSRVKERLNIDGVTTSKGVVKTGMKSDGTIYEQVGDLNFINEPNLYRVIFQSKKEEAHKFQNWIFEEVIPSIRKHGIYATKEVLSNPDTWIKVLEELKADREKISLLSETVGIQKQQILEMAPKASYYDLVLNCKDAVAITTIAKDYGKSGQWLNDYLHELGVQFRQGNIWLLYQKHAKNGYTYTKTHNHLGDNGEVHSKVHTYWTQKGRLFIYDLLKENELLPLIERQD